MNKEFKNLQKAATVEDAIYNLNILEAIKISANTGVSVVFNKELNSYV